MKLFVKKNILWIADKNPRHKLFFQNDETESKQDSWSWFDCIHEDDRMNYLEQPDFLVAGFL
jgi:hypothetical protein